MEKEFIPYEIALELKKIGFDEICIGAYFPPSISKMKYPQYFYSNTGLMMGEDSCTAPLYQQVFRWFREKYYLNYEINYAGKKGEYYAFVNQYVYGNNGNSPSIFTYEEAELACIKKLIEIVKNK